MLKSITNLVMKFKLILIFTGLLVITFTALFIYTRVYADANPDIRIDVKPTLTLSPCFNNKVPPKTTIVSPTDGTKYTTGDKVSLTGIAVLECNNTKLEEKDLNWYLDSDTTPFAMGYAYSLEGLKAGNYKIKLVATSKDLKSEVAVNISVFDPKPQVLGIKAPVQSPTPVPVPPPNQAPLITIISPKPTDIFSVDSVVDITLKTVLKPIEFTFKGSATDDYDSIIPESNFTWYIGDPSTGKVGTGTTVNYLFVPAVSCPTTLDISLRVKDSTGKEATSTVTVKVTYVNGAVNLCPGSANENLNTPQ